MTHKMNRRANLRVVNILMDIGGMIIAFFLAYFLTPARFNTDKYSQYLLMAASFIVVSILFMNAFGMYRMSTFNYVDRTVKNTLLSVGGSSITVFSYLFITYNTDLSRLFLFVFIISGTVFLIVEKLMAISYRGRRPSEVTVIFVGNEKIYNDFIHYSQISGSNHKILGYVDMGGNEIKDANHLGNINDLESIIKEYPCNQIIFTQSMYGGINLEPYLKIAGEMGLIIRVMLDMYTLDSSQKFISTLGTYPVITYHSVMLDNISLFIKRCLDIMGALIGIILSLPIMITTAIVIKLDSPGPLIFSQMRVGCNGKKFKIYKFRSMYVDAEQRKKDLMQQNQMSDSRLFKIKDDPRITRVGKIIRKTSIDEIPQFFNVLFGDMSLVGTRPPTVDEVALYERQHWRRISIKPGITGVWQTNGRNDVTDFEKIVQMDLSYIEKWSLILDFILIFRTFKVLFKRKGAC